MCLDSVLGRLTLGCAVVPEGEIARTLASADRRLTVDQAEDVRVTTSSGHSMQIIEAWIGRR